MREHALIVGFAVLLAGLPPAARATDQRPVPESAPKSSADTGVSVESQTVDTDEAAERMDDDRADTSVAPPEASSSRRDAGTGASVLPAVPAPSAPTRPGRVTPVAKPAPVEPSTPPGEPKPPVATPAPVPPAPVPPAPVVPMPDATPAPVAPVPTVAPRLEMFNQRDFRGVALTLDAAGSNIRFSPRAARTTGGAWQICARPFFGGRCDVIEGSHPHLSLHRSFSGTVQSARPISQSASDR